VAGGPHARQGRGGGPGRPQGERPIPQDPSLPTSNVFFYADDLQQTYNELTARGVEFPLPPVQQPFGWWSLFADPDGNRSALVPREQ
jgi:predicted enzyme related to lactoylglutathione lyase